MKLPPRSIFHTSNVMLLTLTAALWHGQASAEPDQPVAPTSTVASVVSAAESAYSVSSALVLTKASELRAQVSTTASDLVMTALGFLGVPYRRGGEDAAQGFDCSGFVRSTYEQTLGLVLPRRAEEQARATTRIGRDELKPGDLVFFNTMRRAFSHVGIYLGDGKFIHAPRPGQYVRVEDMRVAYWNKRFNGARRVDAAADLDMKSAIGR
jgi:cell wall-associated NlpC family hydrolase